MLELAKEKRKMRLIAKQSEQATLEYRKICNVVRASARKDKQNWLEKQCVDIEKYAGEYKTREVFKMIKIINRSWQPKRTAIKDKTRKHLDGKRRNKRKMDRILQRAI